MPLPDRDAEVLEIFQTAGRDLTTEEFRQIWRSPEGEIISQQVANRKLKRLVFLGKLEIKGSRQQDHGPGKPALLWGLPARARSAGSSSVRTAQETASGISGSMCC